MFRLLRFVIGALLVPLCMAVTLALLDVLRSFPVTGSLLSPETAWLLTGYLLWLGMWLLLPQPVRAYVIAHELTHALWALLCGGRAHSLRVTSRGGSVRVSKSNLLITLAPYFFPLYTLLVLLLRLLANLLLTETPAPLVWIFFVGLTWGFHATFTVQSLMTSQPDIEEYGRLFSYAIIYLFNIVGVGLWVVCATSATFSDLAGALAFHALSVYASVYDELCARAAHLYQIMQPVVQRLAASTG